MVQKSLQIHKWRDGDDDDVGDDDDDDDGDDDDGEDHADHANHADHDKNLSQIHKWREGRTDEGERPRTYDKFYQVFFIFNFTRFFNFTRVGLVFTRFAQNCRKYMHAFELISYIEPS